MPHFNLNFKEWKNLSGLSGKTKLIVAFLIGILLLVIAIPTSSQKTASSASERDMISNQIDTGESNPVISNMYSDEYKEYENLLETRMEEILEKVEGVGKVSVMITLKSSSEQVIEKDTDTDSQVSENDTQNSTTKTSIYAQSSDGSQNPYVKKIYTPQIEGVIVIADGGNNSVVIQNITESIQALFGVEAHKIKIMKRATS